MSYMRLFIITGILVTALMIASGCMQQQDTTAGTGPNGGPAASDPAARISTESWKHVRLETNMGNITIALDPAMPITSGNFETLVGKGYYNGVIFHRVMDGFMIQGGDPTGTGRGGPGYTIKDEFLPRNRNDRGTVAMANAGPDTGGSQFFINLVNNNYLDSLHPVFGKVVDGIDIVDKIAKVPTSGKAGGFRPLQNVTIIRAVMV